MSRILCAMSGGVDSSVAAALLQRAGHEVLGVFLRLGAGGHDRGAARGCCSVNDAQDAARVADRLRIPFYALNHERQFGAIIEYFVDEYNRGRTPNPCARCNQWLKFGSLRRQAEALGCERLATGHYARLVPPRVPADRPRLRRGADAAKDQSYFLFAMPPESLAMAEFPIGGFAKAEVRALARELELPVADKPDSQEICFVPGDDYRAVLRARAPAALRAGDFVDRQGRVLGRHGGHQLFTIGQRRGLEQSFGAPRYVIAIDSDSNAVTLGGRDELAASRFRVEELNWLSWPAPVAGESLAAEVQIRYRSRPVPATLLALDDGAVQVELEGGVDAVTPGQAAVFYDDDLVLGGGWIAAALPAARS